jgi:hypothetical protein
VAKLPPAGNNSQKAGEKITPTSGENQQRTANQSNTQ